MSQETLGDRIKKVRKELGLSLDTLAAKSDITKSHLRMLEVSATQPSIRNLRKIAEALGVNAGYLVDGSTRSVNSSMYSVIAKPDEEVTICCKEFGKVLKVVFGDRSKYSVSDFHFSWVPRKEEELGAVFFNFFNEKDVN